MIRLVTATAASSAVSSGCNDQSPYGRIASSQRSNDLPENGSCANIRRPCQTIDPLATERQTSFSGDGRFGGAKPDEPRRQKPPASDIAPRIAGTGGGGRFSCDRAARACTDSGNVPRTPGARSFGTARRLESSDYVPRGAGVAASLCIRHSAEAEAPLPDHISLVPEPNDGPGQLTGSAGMDSVSLPRRFSSSKECAGWAFQVQARRALPMPERQRHLDQTAIPRQPRVTMCS